MSPLFHYANWKSNETLGEIIPIIESLANSWENPSFKIERIIFSKLSSARQFLENLQSTPWYEQIQQEKIKQGFRCKDGCKNSEDIPIKTQNFTPILPPLIVSGLDSIFGLTPILKMFQETQEHIKLEILTPDEQPYLRDLTIFLQDHLSEITKLCSPRFSELCTKYEINYSTQKHRKKRSRKPSANFQRILKKNGGPYSSELIGNVYYGSTVFDNFLSLESEGEFSHEIRQFRPRSPMKGFDFVEEGWVEFRFPTGISAQLISKWLANLQEIESASEGGLEMFRISASYEAWNEGPMYKHAGSDRFYLTGNDIELAFAQQNQTDLREYRKNTEKKRGNLRSCYFQLSPPILDPDFRIELIKEKLKHDVFMR